MAVEKVCKQCGKHFFVSPSKIKQRKCEFCCRDCYKKWHDLNNSLVDCVCKICGKPFKVQVCHIKRGQGKYCSKECRCKSLCKPWIMPPVEQYKLFLKEYKRLINYFAYKYCYTSSDRDDIKQEMYISLLRAVGNTNGIAPKKYFHIVLEGAAIRFSNRRYKEVKNTCGILEYKS